MFYLRPAPFLLCDPAALHAEMFDALDDEFLARWTGWYRAPTAVGASCLLQWLGTGKGADLIATAVVRLRLLRVHIPGLRPFLAQVHASRESLRTFIRFPTVVPEAASEFLANMQRYFARVRMAACCCPTSAPALVLEL
jgi:hypothetical protein